MIKNGYDSNGCVGAIYGRVFSSIPLFALIYLAVWLIAQFVTP